MTENENNNNKKKSSLRRENQHKIQEQVVQSKGFQASQASQVSQVNLENVYFTMCCEGLTS